MSSMCEQQPYMQLVGTQKSVKGIEAQQSVTPLRQASRSMCAESTAAREKCTHVSTFEFMG